MELLWALAKLVFGIAGLWWVFTGGVDRLFRPMEKLVKDAYRYRWLREQHQIDRAPKMWVCGADCNYVGRDLDAAIDVALKTPNSKSTTPPVA